MQARFPLLPLQPPLLPNRLMKRSDLFLHLFFGGVI